MKTLYRVRAPHYIAAVWVTDGVCTEAAPIVRWAHGKSWAYLQRYFAGKGYEILDLGDPTVTP